MNDEEVKRMMDFILDRQAGISVSQEKAEERMATLESVVTRLANASLQRIEASEQKQEILIDAQIKSEDAIQKLSESHERLAAAQAELAESQSRMDDQITILAVMFERFIERSMSNENDAMM